MQVFIKDKKTFATKYGGKALDWDITLQSIYDEVSNITIRRGENPINSGDYVFAGDYCGIVRDVETERELLILSCRDMATMFERPLLPPDTWTGTSIEDWIKGQIDRHYTNQQDGAYRLPYLKVIARTSTPGTTAPDIEDGVWNIKSYLSKVRRLHNIHITFEAKNQNLVVRIIRRTRQEHKIFLDSTQFDILEESYSSDTISKITTITSETNIRKDWYLLTDGTITDDYTLSNRVEGKWEIVTIKEAGEAEQAARDKFAENSKSHLIEFAADQRYEFYDNLLIRTKKGVVVISYISAIRMEKGREKLVYKSGELRTLLTDKINKGGK